MHQATWYHHYKQCTGSTQSYYTLDLFRLSILFSQYRSLDDTRSLFNEHDHGPNDRHMICIGKPKLRSEKCRLVLLSNQRAARKSKMTGQIHTDQGSQKTPLLSFKTNAFHNFFPKKSLHHKCTRLPFVFNSRENAHVLEYNQGKSARYFLPPFLAQKIKELCCRLGRTSGQSELPVAVFQV